MNKFSWIYLLSFIVILSLSSTNAHSQLVSTFGLKGGVNFTTFSSDIEGYEFKPGVLIGGFLEVRVPLSPISIQPEMIYTQFGATIGDTDVNVNLNYIQIPILLKYSINAPGAKPNLIIGPYLNYMIGSELEGDGGTVDIDELTNSSAVGFILGAGVDNNKIQVGLRANFGSSEVFTDDATDGETNFGVSFTIGVKL